MTVSEKHVKKHVRIYLKKIMKLNTCIIPITEAFSWSKSRRISMHELQIIPKYNNTLEYFVLSFLHTPFSKCCPDLTMLVYFRTLEDITRVIYVVIIISLTHFIW